MATRVEHPVTRPVEHALDDRGLVLAFQAGDRAAYDVIFQRYGPMTERICRRYLINPHDAEEATQETMLRVLRSLPSFNGRYNLRAWVARIATNLCLDRLRQETRKANGEELNVVYLEHQNDEASAKADPSEVLDQVVRREEIRAHLKTLPENHRIALVLRDVEGFGHREIAQVLGTTPARVKALLHRARKGFRSKWNDGERQLGIILAPLAWLAGWMRRVQGRAQELATTAGGGASSPVTTTLAATGGDHMSAALAAVVLAGTVGFAAGSAPEVDTPEPPREEIVLAAVPDPVIKESPDRDRQVPDREPKASDQPEVTVPPAAMEEEVAAPQSEADKAKEVAAAEEAELPEPQPQATVRPQPATPAGFTFGFTSDWMAAQPCGCADQARIVSQLLSEERGEPAGFSTQIDGGAMRDVTGQPGWPIELAQTGTKTEHSLEFVVSTFTGGHTYKAVGTQVSRERTDWGGWRYVYAGTYEKIEGPEESPPLPAKGTYTASLTFAVREGRLVDAAFSLANAEYAG